MAMSRKDYQAFAEMIKYERYEHPATPQARAHNYAIERIARQMADYFKHDNVRFDRNRFMEACGL